MSDLRKFLFLMKRLVKSSNCNLSSKLGSNQQSSKLILIITLSLLSTQIAFLTIFLTFGCAKTKFHQRFFLVKEGEIDPDLNLIDYAVRIASQFFNTYLLPTLLFQCLFAFLWRFVATIIIFLFRTKFKQMCNLLFDNHLFKPIPDQNPRDDSNLDRETSSRWRFQEVIRNNCLIKVEASLIELFRLKIKMNKFLRRVSLIGLSDLVLITLAFSFQMILFNDEIGIYWIRCLFLMILIWSMIGAFIGSFLIKFKKENLCQSNVINNVRAMEFILNNDHSYHSNNHICFNICSLHSLHRRSSIKMKYNDLSKMYHQFIE